MQKISLPYFDNRNSIIDTIVIHCSAHNPSQMIRALEENKLSSHYIIAENGEIIQCVDEDKRAWHAGKSYWYGDESLNKNSIGIELCHPTLGQSPYAETQISALTTLCKEICQRHNIKNHNIVGHSDIAPTRKPDPGLGFPWQQLAINGLGLWADKLALPETDYIKLLAIIGYDTNTPELTQASAYAFCRHFLPQFVNIDSNINHLVDNVVNSSCSFITDNTFLNMLSHVAYSYQQSRSR